MGAEWIHDDDPDDAAPPPDRAAPPPNQGLNIGTQTGNVFYDHTELLITQVHQVNAIRQELLETVKNASDAKTCFLLYGGTKTQAITMLEIKAISWNVRGLNSPLKSPWTGQEQEVLEPTAFPHSGQSGPQPIDSACKMQISNLFEEFEYFQDGDIIIGGLVTVNTHITSLSPQEDDYFIQFCVNLQPQYYRQLVEFRLAIEEINKNPSLLPNVTLGYHIYDTCGQEQNVVRNTFQILSGSGELVPNYSCGKKRNIAGFIGDLTSETTIISAQILSLFGFSQISYGASDLILSDKITFPYFFRTLQSYHGSSLVLSQLLNHFGWTWVGILSIDNNSGEKELQVLMDYFTRVGICVEFTIKITHYLNHISYDDQMYINTIKEIIQKSTTNILVVCGKLSKPSVIRLINLEDALIKKTLIFSPSASAIDHIMKSITKTFHGSLIFEQYTVYPRETHEIMEFMNSIHPFKNSEDKLLEDIFLVTFTCSSKDQYKNQLYEYLYKTYYAECAENYITEALGYLNNILLNVLSPHVHLAVDIMSQAVHEMHNSLSEKSPEKDKMFHHYPYEIPRAQCTDSCQSGYRKALKPGAQPCCYYCVQCSEGEISNRTDRENCYRCPELERPNDKRNQCIAKTEEFLSYTSNVISAFLTSTAFLFSLITLLILGVFVSYWDTPIVRANNRSLSFLLLVSIKLSFLSVFLFLGRPVDITCMLRNITFGITFSIAVSSLLAKTIMVCVAFKATKPGSSWRKWVGVKLSNSVVLICSSIQIIICMTWLAISPPFQELDLHTYPGTIIIQCNEGSAIGFYSVIGYMGLLAAVSFVLAFLARTLPDSFNEAKYITFSMLLFCSVWITMIPAYLSTKGKNTVCVEIFAILTSCAGLLGCIFVPKCYVIMFKPEMNLKSCLLGSKS
ncbi:taste receptor type 1 member 1 [Xenopus laevis]|uniref:Taste receptor type 1 member 1 n=1 Tax=Xenopus laevis TaxID=8355 RepID=A0A8J1LV25_XENLA|nr:taste receptor type 1 member 1 [Xenopus laevis]